MIMIFSRHVDYIHFNPVKHGHVQRVAARVGTKTCPTYRAIEAYNAM
jgi:hypothetical protein